MQTVFDAIGNWVEDALSEKRVQTMTLEDFEEIASAIDSFYENRGTAIDTDNAFYSGGWAAGNWMVGAGRQYLYSSCLYYPTVIVHDPLAEWFFLHRNRLTSLGPVRSASGSMQIMSGEVDLLTGFVNDKSDLARIRAEFLSRAKALVELRPLIDTGAVHLVSPWHIVRRRQDAILTAVRHDIRDDQVFNFVSSNVSALPRSDQIRGAMMTPDDGWNPTDLRKAIVKDPLYFYNKTIAIADEVGAKYIPPEAADASLLKLKLESLHVKLRESDVELKIVPGLVSTNLPYFKHLDTETLIAVRGNEQAFEDWRRELRNAFYNVRSSTSDDMHFKNEANQVLSDALIPVANNVENALRKSNYLSKIASESMLSMTAGVIGVVGAQQLMHSTDPAAIPGVLMTGAFSWLYRATFGRPPTDQLVGSKAVIANLIERRA